MKPYGNLVSNKPIATLATLGSRYRSHPARFDLQIGSFRRKENVWRKSRRCPDRERSRSKWSFAQGSLSLCQKERSSQVGGPFCKREYSFNGHYQGSSHSRWQPSAPLTIHTSPSASPVSNAGNAPSGNSNKVTQASNSQPVTAKATDLK